ETPASRATSWMVAMPRLPCDGPRHRSAHHGSAGYGSGDERVQVPAEVLGQDCGVVLVVLEQEGTQTLAQRAAVGADGVEGVPVADVQDLAGVEGGDELGQVHAV